MDITTITDVKELKAMAYDELARLEQSQNNLKLLNQRIAELNSQETPAKKAAK